MLTDGTGGMTFLKALVYDYLKRLGKDIGDPGDIPVDTLWRKQPRTLITGFIRVLFHCRYGRRAFHLEARLLEPGHCDKHRSYTHGENY